MGLGSKHMKGVGLGSKHMKGSKHIFIKKQDNVGRYTIVNSNFALLGMLSQ